MAIQHTKIKTDYGFIRVASALPRVNVGDVDYNTENIIEIIHQASERHAQLIVFPELSVTGYTCGDLLGNEALLNDTELALERISKEVSELGIIIAVGAPLRHQGHLFNCAVIMQGDKMWAVPKTYLPNYKEFYEKRWFTSDNITRATISEIEVCGRKVPMGTNFIFDAGSMKFAVEICEDLWVPIPPSSLAAINGANVIINLSASNELVGKHDYLVDLIKHQSDHSIAAYIYSSSGYGESTTDLVFAGNAIISENGVILKEAKRFVTEPQLSIADIDIEALENERRINGSFTDSLLQHSRNYIHIPVSVKKLNYEETKLERIIRKSPFVPTETSRLDSRCEEIVNIQTQGLMRRLEFTHIKSLVIGISGGLDSTLALMVAVRAFDRMGYDRKGIYGITMPGFGTTSRTHKNALMLMEALGITVKEISIADAVKQHFSDIGHDGVTQDVTYENCQARERTQILMDYSNKVNALVLGTGDLSELALGWATYNGDHMSMYNVNCSIPKTLAKHLVMWFAATISTSNPIGMVIHETLLDVLHTPISPELTNKSDSDSINQMTEDLVGPYELHDFFLYNMLRHGYAPAKIYFLARTAFKGTYDNATIKKWLTVFMRRFFVQQFKRSCLPDGPKVGNVSLSPRGDWRMPSDMAGNLWNEQCKQLPD
ncbi:MAG: NAD(+) synthase [Bacteroidales bacterium]|nr:NAD(+) synthase [Candidatus Sodaliphilus aphodohippi]